MSSIQHSALGGAFARLYDRPYVLLVLTLLFWSGNFVLARGVSDVVPPIGLAFWRWFGGLLLLLPFAWRHLAADWAVLLRSWRMVTFLALSGVAAFNTFVYIGLGSTTAINAALLQSTMPLCIVLFSFLLFGERIGWLQGLGVLLSLAGVVAIATRGDLAHLAAFHLNSGDAWVLLAVVCYALYSATLRRRPKVHPLSFLAATFALGALALLPFYVWESLGGQPMRLLPVTFLSVAYVAIFPAVLAYFCWNRGVELVGANRAGQFHHLLPAFGSVMAMAFLGESFLAYHAAGIALIFAGIWAATRGRAAA